MTSPTTSTRRATLVTYVSRDHVTVLSDGLGGVRREFAMRRGDDESKAEVSAGVLATLKRVRPLIVLGSCANDLPPDDPIEQVVSIALSFHEDECGYMLHAMPDLRALAAALPGRTSGRGRSPRTPPRAPPPSFRAAPSQSPNPSRYAPNSADAFAAT